jgi:type IX secretion system substrate protein
LSYFDAELNSLDENTLIVATSADNANWTNQGFTVRNTTTNWVTKTGIADLARVTLTGPLNALPLVWSAFNTSCENNGVKISWKTVQETNTSAFYIRRSANGSNWQTIATLAAAGNSNTAISYSFTDPLSFSGAVYRVVQEDLNGVQTVSPVLYSKCDIGDGVTVYPNPAYSQCWVSVQSASSTTVTMRLYDIKGVLVKQQLEAVQAGSNQIGFQMNGLPQGIYNLVIGWGSGKQKTVKIEKR